MRKFSKKKGKIVMKQTDLAKENGEKNVYSCQNCQFLGRVTSPGVPVRRRLCIISNEEVDPFGTCQCVGCGTPEIIDSVTK